MRTRSLLAFALLLALPLAVPAGAQQGQAPTVTGETGLFTLLDGFTLPRGGWSFGLYYNNWDRLVAPVPGPGLAAPFSDDWDYDLNRLSASVGYGLSDRFELSLMVPWDDISERDVNRLGYVNGHLFEDRIDVSGIGNVRLGGKLRLAGSAEEGRALALNAFVELPTGDEDEGVVTGDTGWGLGLNWSPNANWVARAGYRDPGDSDEFDVAEEFEAGVGNAARVTDDLDWITELAATLYQGGDSAPDDTFDLTSGARLWFGESRNWAFNFALRLELAQLSDTDKYCPIGGLVGLTFFPRPAPPPPP
ncbi:MAG: transporter, partial [Thermoanaerobaculia bacterium]